jgi:hypothetical protein
MPTELPKEEQRRVCDGCGKANFLPYSIRIGEQATAVERVYCSLACARLHFPGFTGQTSGR